jgi:hypothetical protein
MTQSTKQEKRLTENQLRILKVYFEEDMDTWGWSLPFRGFDKLGLDRKTLSKEFKGLREMELVEFNRGLFNEEEETAGSGYGLNYKKRKEIEELMKQPHQNTEERNSRYSVRELLEKLVLEIGLQVTDNYEEVGGLWEGLSVWNVQSIDRYEKILNFKLTQARQETVEEVMEPLKKLADHQMSQRAIRYPEFIKGINKAGEELKGLLTSLSQNKVSQKEGK